MCKKITFVIQLSLALFFVCPAISKPASDSNSIEKSAYFKGSHIFTGDQKKYQDILMNFSKCSSEAGCNEVISKMMKSIYYDQSHIYRYADDIIKMPTLAAKKCLIRFVGTMYRKNDQLTKFIELLATDVYEKEVRMAALDFLARSSKPPLALLYMAYSETDDKDIRDAVINGLSSKMIIRYETGNVDCYDYLFVNYITAHSKHDEFISALKYYMKFLNGQPMCTDE